MLDDVIVALATAPMESAIAVIRVSGENSFELLEKIFNKKINIQKHKAYFGNIIDEEEIIDEVIITTFVAPNSFTGENSFEISCHGGLFIINRIISTCIKNGARLANKGEFSKRAYLSLPTKPTAALAEKYCAVSEKVRPTAPSRRLI